VLKDLDLPDGHETGRWLTTRVETSRQPFRRRERVMLCFHRMLSLQKSVAMHLSVKNLPSAGRTLSSRDNFKARCTAALGAWRQLCAT
jgi:putative transposase